MNLLSRQIKFLKYSNYLFINKMLILEPFYYVFIFYLPILAYGSTEGMRLTVNIYSRSKEGSVGVLVPGLEGKVHDLNLLYIKYMPVYFIWEDILFWHLDLYTQFV